MKNKIILLFLFIPLLGFSNVVGRVNNIEGDPLVGINVYWMGTGTGVVTDMDGRFSIANNSTTDLLVFSGVSYRSDTVRVSASDKELKIVLSDVIELSQVEVVRKKLSLVKSQTSVFQTEKITPDELVRAACCNLAESFETNPSVDVTYSDAATGAKQIRLLGLSGNYVQMLTENIPNLRGISFSYGLGFIPGTWMEGIQVSKGTSSVINGYEAITGQINVEYKKPLQSEDLALNMFTSDAGRVEANLTGSLLLTDYLSTALFLHSSDDFRNNDKNGDDFLDMPKVRQHNVANRWFYKKGAYISQVFLKALYEKRIGGQIKNDYKIGVDTRRYEFFTKNGYVFNAEKQRSVGFILSGSWHKQDAGYGKKFYDGTQKNLYANLIFQNNFSDAHKLSAGASFNLDDYEEKLFSETDTLFLKKEYVPGAFLEYSYNWNDKLVLLAGLRADYSSYHQRLFLTPRLHAKYAINEYVRFRASAGKGFRSPHVWAENNYLLASSRLIEFNFPSAKMEEAWNYGFSVQSDIPIYGRNLSLSAEWYYTDFLQQLVVDVDSDPHKVLFTNLNGQRSYASNMQFEANMEVFRGFTLTLAHRITDVKTTINGKLREKPLTNSYKSLITASYQTKLKKWQFDFTTQINGGGRLPDPTVVGENLSWEKRFDSHAIMNAQITKNFRTWSLYAGVENLAGFVQKNPIVDVTNPFGERFDATMVWGPTHGRKIYLGFRWALAREKRKAIFSSENSVLNKIEKTVF